MPQPSNVSPHVPLHELDAPMSARTAGRVAASPNDPASRLENAHGAIPVEWSAEREPPTPGTLVEVAGHWNGQRLQIEEHLWVSDGEKSSTMERRDDAPSLSEAISARSSLNRSIRAYFDDAGFLEVETPNAVDEPGTDIYLEPIGTRSLEERTKRTVPPFLHTSPEFAMKRLLAEGLEKIYQLVKVWRDGEITDLHHPEFTLLEWYRAWEPLDAIMADCERIVTDACGESATVVERTPDGREVREVALEPPFERITMRELVGEAAGFDLLDALDYASLRRAVVERDLLRGDLDRRHPPKESRWDDLFFDLMVTELEPRLAKMGAVFVTEWPAPLAVLARKSEADPRIAHRFELFVGGVELANGFDELVDPDAQRTRFERELEERKNMEMPRLPMPERFLGALERGLPRSCGVALGVDRLLMLALGVPRIDDVAPYAHVPKLRDP